MGGERPQKGSVSFQKVTYGGINGAYYTASATRRTGNDGVSKLPSAFSFLHFFFIRILAVEICYGFRRRSHIKGSFGNQVVLEDRKEADSTTGQATHRISKGIIDKVMLF